jgi:hypothetical protein
MAHHRPHPTTLQPRNASALAPIVVLDSAPASPAIKSIDSALLSPQQLDSDDTAVTHHSPVTRQHAIPIFNPGPPIQLRVAIAIDPEHQNAKLVKSMLHMALVLTALVQKPDGREIWIEQCRTELLSLDKVRKRLGVTAFGDLGGILWNYSQLF